MLHLDIEIVETRRAMKAAADAEGPEPPDHPMRRGDVSTSRNLARQIAILTGQKPVENYAEKHTDLEGFQMF